MVDAPIVGRFEERRRRLTRDFSIFKVLGERLVGRQTVIIRMTKQKIAADGILESTIIVHEYYQCKTNLKGNKQIQPWGGALSKNFSAHAYPTQ